VGETPSNVEIKEGETVQFTIKKEGFHDGSATYHAGAAPKVNGRLEKIREENNEEELKGYPAEKKSPSSSDDDGLMKPKGQ
jgi:hypothetical protein